MLLLALWLQVTPAAEIAVRPEVPLLARGHTGLELQCDLLVSNPGTLEWRLDELEVTARDSAAHARDGDDD